VLYVPMKHVDAKAGTITFDDEDGTRRHPAGHRRPGEAAVEAGLRHALGSASASTSKCSARITRPMPSSTTASATFWAGTRRSTIVYELFLDENGPEDLEVEGQRPHHRRVADLRADREPWALHVPEARARPRSLYFDVIPRAVDEYYTFLSAYPRQEWKERLGNPVWHMHDGNPPGRHARAVLDAAQPGQRLQRA
jgi:lysyl-tRNA synthetase class 1